MRRLQLAAAIVASTAFLSCGGSPASPTAPARTTASTGAAVTANVVRVTVVGTPPTIGSSSQFTAMAVQADGTTQPVTTQATWGSSDASLATVTGAGVVTTKSAGTVTISATYAGSQGSLSFTVTSAATFTVRGTVADAGSRAGIAATVTAKDASGSVRSAAADSSGAYSIPGVPAGTVILTATATGYATDARSVTVYGDTTYSFLLSRLSACPQIGFDNIGSAQGAPFTAYTACGFTVTATTSNWTVSTTYGHPAPFIQFMTAGNTVGTGEVVVRAGGAAFTFQSVDVYSSTTPIPYVITGIANGATVFTFQNMVGNTYGNFATVSNPNPAVQVDTLVIRLTNPSVPISNPMGLDNIVVK